MKPVETARLIIRPLTLADADFILELLNSEGWIKFIGDRNIKEKAECEQYIQKILDNENYQYQVFALKPNGNPIGVVTLLKREEYEYPDIGYAILPGFERKGYTFEAARICLDNIIQLQQTEKVLGITMPTNINSIKLLERLGLRFTNRFIKDSREVCRYELTIKPASDPS